MNKIIAALGLLALTFVSTSTALADAEPKQWYLTGMASYIDDDRDRGVDDGVVGGQGGFGYALSDHWNIETYLSYASMDGVNDQTQLAGGVDFQLLFARESALTPYFFAGIGYMEVNPDVGSTEQGETYSGGAGVLADIFGSSQVALRLEYRYRHDEVFAEPRDDQLVSLGLHIPFGAKRAVPVPMAAPDPDSDGDGVPDSRDQCPNTPAGVQVDASGCALDSDRDSVPDHIDECPNTVAGAPVDARGCELDSDSDGVVDRLDQCPNTRAGAQVDVRGCEIREEIRLPGVNFETNSDRLLPGAESVLNDAAETLRRNPSIRVEVAGHTDSDGAAAYNEGLSQRRAETVRDYLISRGVANDRLSARGYGESEPIADNSTAAGKAQNRRVVLRIVER
jgi:OOP family OmpA-OmpF porin